MLDGDEALKVQPSIPRVKARVGKPPPHQRSAVPPMTRRCSLHKQGQSPLPLVAHSSSVLFVRIERQRTWVVKAA